MTLTNYEVDTKIVPTSNINKAADIIPYSFILLLISSKSFRTVWITRQLVIVAVYGWPHCLMIVVRFLKNVITDDGTWVCSYEVETKAQLSQWNGMVIRDPSSEFSGPKKPRCSSPNVNIMMTIFFDRWESWRLIELKFWRSCESDRRKRSEFWCRGIWVLLHICRTVPLVTKGKN